MCRNTVCISNFSNRRIGGKDPPKREDAIVRCCLSIAHREERVNANGQLPLFLLENGAPAC